MTEAEVLKPVPLLEGLSEVQLEAIAARGEEREVVAGAVVFEEGSDGHELFLLLEGKVQITIEMRRADEQVPVHTVVPGHVFGEFALLAGMERSATARAMQDSRFFVLSRRAFEELAEQDPLLGFCVLRHLTEVLVGRIVKTTHELRLSLMF